MGLPEGVIDGQDEAVLLEVLGRGAGIIDRVVHQVGEAVLVGLDALPRAAAALTPQKRRLQRSAPRRIALRSRCAAEERAARVRGHVRQSGSARSWTSCWEADAACFVKQLGRHWARKHGARSRTGADPIEWPEGLRVRLVALVRRPLPSRAGLHRGRGRDGEPRYPLVC